MKKAKRELIKKKVNELMAILEPTEDLLEEWCDEVTEETEGKTETWLESEVGANVLHLEETLATLKDDLEEARITIEDVIEALGNFE